MCARQLSHCPPNLGPPKPGPQQTPRLAPPNVPRDGVFSLPQGSFLPKFSTPSPARSPAPHYQACHQHSVPGGSWRASRPGAGETLLRPQGHLKALPCPSPAPLPTQTDHPQVKIEIQLPISWQSEYINRVTSLRGKSQHVQASPGR